MKKFIHSTSIYWVPTGTALGFENKTLKKWTKRPLSLSLHSRRDRQIRTNKQYKTRSAQWWWAPQRNTAGKGEEEGVQDCHPSEAAQRKLPWEGIFEQGPRGAGHQPAGIKRKGTWASAPRSATLRWTCALWTEECKRPGRLDIGLEVIEELCTHPDLT